MKNKKKFANRKKRLENKLNKQPPAELLAENLNQPKDNLPAQENPKLAEEVSQEEVLQTEISTEEALQTGVSEAESDAAKETEDLSEEKTSERIFALDIGTRSVIGIVAEKTEAGEIKILATSRREHKTRAMLDGQIHDVPEVASAIIAVKEILESETGKLKSAAVAAAGRALYTMKAEAQLKLPGVITEADEKNLEFLGVQKAQEALANSKTIEDSANYCCVGYSTISYALDDIPLKSLVGQKGNVSKVSVIATFLPRQVIDSMQSALSEAGLTMRALTLEPIAAINVLIPPTMRHLNLALVDIGAGTSDIALTRDGSVFAYGMVPLAGDEITEALSQRFLLDFKVAEDAKRKASRGEDAKFSDILGTDYDLTAAEIIEPIVPAIRNLAEAISQEIVNLNGNAPQAVILVGGGALTPNLSPILAEILNMPPDRVAVRKPEKAEGIEELPPELQTSDSVTPLGILKIASINTLHFLTIYVNGEEHGLFNFRELTVSDALLNAGVNPKKFNGRPGLALTITVDGETKFFPGTVGSLAKIKLNGEDASLDTAVKSEDKIDVVRGADGEVPKVMLNDVIRKKAEKIARVNGKDVKIPLRYFVNGKIAEKDVELKDGDTVEGREEITVGEILKLENLSPEGKRINYTLNGNKSHFMLRAEILLNGAAANLSAKVQNGDVIKYNVNERPTLKDVLDIDESATNLRITYNKEERFIPAANIELTVNGKPATNKTVIEDGANISYKELPRVTTTVSDALLAVNFEPPAATSRMKFDILVNGRSAEFIDPVKNGDSLEVVLTKIGEPSPVNKTDAPTAEKAEDKTRENLQNKPKETPVNQIRDLADRAVPVGSFKQRFQNALKNTPAQSPASNLKTGLPNIPGLSEAIAASKK